MLNEKKYLISYVQSLITILMNTDIKKKLYFPVFDLIATYNYYLLVA